MDSMLMKLNVFVDTQVFRRLGLHFEGMQLSRLRRLGSHGLVNILLTDVIEQEVLDALTSQWHQMEGTKYKLEKLLRPFSCSEEKPRVTVPILSPHSHAGEAFSYWLNRANTNILSTSDVNTGELMSLYFSGKPPFSAKKKEEFPDAISLLALRDCKELQGETIYLISADSDLVDWCSNNDSHHSLKSLSDFLDMIAKDQTPNIEKISKLLEKSRDKIISHILLDYAENDDLDECYHVVDAAGLVDHDDCELQASPQVNNHTFGNFKIIELLENSVLISGEAEIEWRSRFQSSLAAGIVSDTTYYDFELAIKMEDANNEICLEGAWTRIRRTGNKGYNILREVNPVPKDWAYQ
jgi:hypothetical protein